MTKPVLLFLTLLASGCSLVESRDVSVRGRVTDDTTGEPIAANVALEASLPFAERTTLARVTTGTDGRFDLSGEAPPYAFSTYASVTSVAVVEYPRLGITEAAYVGQQREAGPATDLGDVALRPTAAVVARWGSGLAPGDTLVVTFDAVFGGGPGLIRSGRSLPYVQPRPGEYPPRESAGVVVASGEEVTVRWRYVPAGGSARSGTERAVVPARGEEEVVELSL